ncbi:beta-lactamase family protein [Rhodococcus spelaei]|uniref:Beta-lactamase family protein n=1 Tax=Rhodococcus spelaei TaxID=2546320 RepID=A0A541B473_9NOCA|nr:serine hydrolase domain-containing protein [Rhodococcus spelaei]TQF67119.1 beta-lactamase family protein [Rhodococcus spelaei]
MTLTQGFCDTAFEPVREALEQQLATGEELGASICVTVDGEPVVDIWGGHTDTTRDTAWERDTLVNVFSITKTMTALSALLLVDRGLLDLDEKVAHYWPEFAANGKADVEIRHLLAHTSGVSGWEPPMQLEDVYDHESAAARLAGQPLWWEPGTASGYHALNYGHLIGEVIRRIDGRTLGRFFDEELARPLGADFHIGTGPEHFGRIAPIVPPPALEFDMATLDQDSILVKTLTCPLLDYERTADPAWRSAEIGAVNGHGNARSIARLQSIVSGGGLLDGRTWLSPGTVDAIFREQSDGFDLALMTPLRFGIGYGLPQAQTAPTVPDGRVCWWAGVGGSFVVNDLDRGVTFAYAMNKMAPGLIGSDRADAYLTAAFEAVA